MYEQGYISRRQVREVARRRARARARLPLRDPRAAVLLRLRPAGADRPLRGRDRPRGRAARLHDARAATPGGRRSRRSSTRTPPSAPQRRWSRPTPRPARSSRWRPRRPTSRASSTSPPRACASPGSAFKPFVLTTAVDQGIDPDSTYYPAPGSISLDVGYGEVWSVSGGGSGTMSLRQATANSVNTVFAQLGLDVGPRTSPRWRTGWGSPPISAATRPRRSAASPRASRRSRCRTPTRRSPTAACTTSRPRSARSSSPTARSTSPRTRRARGWSATGSPTRSPT